jgi:hypothetical protein
MTTETAAMPRLKAKYQDEIRDQLKEQLGLGNVMEVPRLEKIVVNMGVGGAVAQASLLEHAIADLTLITGQKPLDHPGEEVDRRLQAPRGQRHRRQGHPARRPHVGVPRPADRLGDPPDP